MNYSYGLFVYQTYLTHAFKHPYRKHIHLFPYYFSVDSITYKFFSFFFGVEILHSKRREERNESEIDILYDDKRFQVAYRRYSLYWKYYSSIYFVLSRKFYSTHMFIRFSVCVCITVYMYLCVFFFHSCYSCYCLWCDVAAAFLWIWNNKSRNENNNNNNNENSLFRVFSFTWIGFQTQFLSHTDNRYSREKPLKFIYKVQKKQKIGIRIELWSIHVTSLKMLDSNKWPSGFYF